LVRRRVWGAAARAERMQIDEARALGELRALLREFFVSLTWNGNSAF
jgi:hypothetical protein